jgi:hypothetical protein
VRQWCGVARGKRGSVRNAHVSLKHLGGLRANKIVDTILLFLCEAAA